MRNRGGSSGSFGLLALVIVAAILLFLYARNARTVAPAAADLRRAHAVTSSDGVRVAPDASGGGASGSSGEDTGAGRLPGLGEMRDATSAHSGEVKDALAGAQ